MIKSEVNQKLVSRKHRVNLVWLRRLTEAIEKRLHLRGIRTLSIAFVDHRTMRRLNRTYRDKDKVTDILSFGNDHISSRANLPMSSRAKPRDLSRMRAGVSGHDLGDLILAWPHVKIQAHELGKPLDEELAFLLIHGVLHLRGYDHETKRDAARMLPLQEKILHDFLKDIS